MVVDMIHFDTLEYVKILENAGVSPQQAEAFAKAQQVSLTQNGSILARKSDIDDLRRDMDILGKDIDIKLRDLRLDLQSEIHGLAVKVNQHSWMLGVLLASTGTMMACVFSIMWKIFGW